jgi:hypothetical protein
MRNLLYLVGFIFTLIACQNEEPERVMPTVMEPPTDTVRYLNRQVIRMYGTCQDPQDYTCTRAQLDYILVTSGVEDRIRQRINKTILNRLCADSLSLDAFLDGFLAEYDEYVHSDFEFMDEEPGWFYEGTVKVAMNDPRVLTLAHLVHIFTGGAHGNYTTEFWHFNRKTGFPLELGDLVAADHHDELVELGERFFRRGMKLEVNGSLNDSYGFSFPEDQFYLPEKFAMLPEGLTFIFNTYEIASYADGELQFTIPYPELKDVAKPGSTLATLVAKPPYLGPLTERPSL